MQNMREMADPFGSLEHLRSHGHDPSRFGAAEHTKTALLARHQACLETLRTQREKGCGSFSPPAEIRSAAGVGVATDAASVDASASGDLRASHGMATESGGPAKRHALRLSAVETS